MGTAKIYCLAGGYFTQYAETVEFGNFDMKREFNEMGFVCEAYLQLVEKAVPSHVSNICPDKSKPDLPGHIRSHNPRVKVNQALAWNRVIRRLRANPAKLTSIEDGIHLTSLLDTLGWMSGAACMLEYSK
jgi:GDP-6-deoxy-D-talose 4-dehydrogenase